MVNRSGSHASQRGQSMVEFALVACMLLVLVMMALDGGRALFVHSEMANGASEAARQASLPANLDSNITPGDCGYEPCHVPGVLSELKQLDGFGVAAPTDSRCTTGFDVCYTPSSSATSLPWYGVGENGVPTGLSSSAQPNVVYVFIWYESSTTTGSASAPVWPTCDGTPQCTGRAPGGEVFVDLKMLWDPLTLTSSGGVTHARVTLDAQSAAAVEPSQVEPSGSAS